MDIFYENWLLILIWTTTSISLAYYIGVLTWLFLQPSNKGKSAKITSAISSAIFSLFQKHVIIIGIIIAILASIIYQFFGYKSALGFVSGAFSYNLVTFIAVFTFSKVLTKSLMGSKIGLQKCFNLFFQSSGSITFISLSIGLLLTYSFFNFAPERQPLLLYAFGLSLCAFINNLTNHLGDKSLRISLESAARDNQIEGEILRALSNHSLSWEGVGDIYETFIIALVAGLIIITTLTNSNDPIGQYFFGLLSLGILATFFSRLIPKSFEKSVRKTMYFSLVINTFLLVAASYFVNNYLANLRVDISINALMIIIGLGVLVVGGLIFTIEYYTNARFKLITELSSQLKAANALTEIILKNITTRSLVIPLTLLIAIVIIGFALIGVMGIILILIAVLALSPAISIIGSVSNSIEVSKSVASYSDINIKMSKVLESFNLISVTARSIMESYSSMATIILGILFFYFFTQLAGKGGNYSINDFRIITGLFIGAGFVYIFKAFILQVSEDITKRRSTNLKLLINNQTLDNTMLPKLTVDLFSNLVLVGSLIIAFIVLLLPILISFILGSEALEGFIFGLLSTSFFLIFSEIFVKAAWNSAAYYLYSKSEKLSTNSILKKGADLVMGNISYSLHGSLIKILGLVSLLLLHFSK